MYMSLSEKIKEVEYMDQGTNKTGSLMSKKPPNIWRIISVLLVVLLVSGCRNKEDLLAESEAQTKPAGEGTGTVQNMTEVANGLAQGTQIKAVSTDPRKGMVTKLSHYSLDIDGDGANETIELYTQAERAPDGQMAWDDGQNWLLVVVDGNNYYPLLQQYVQLGNVYYAVWYANSNAVTITAAVATGSNVSLINYIYDDERKAFISQSLFDTDAINMMYNSIPNY